MAHVFISYAHIDGDFAAALIRQLSDAAITAWIDSEQLRAGKDWRTGIDEAIEDSFAVLVIMTPGAQKSEYVTYEWAYALGAKKILIPILLSPTPMHPRLEVLQYLDFTDFNNRPWEKLIRHLQDIKIELDTQQTPKTAQNTTPNYENFAYIQQFLSSLNDPNPMTRHSAAASLGQFKDRAVVLGLIGVLKDTKAAVRESAVKSLGQIGDATAVPHLVNMLKDADYEVREAAAKSLGQIGDFAAVKGLASALRDNDKWVRAAARRALTRIGTTEAIAAITEWEKDE